MSWGGHSQKRKEGYMLALCFEILGPADREADFSPDARKPRGRSQWRQCSKIVSMTTRSWACTWDIPVTEAWLGSPITLLQRNFSEVKWSSEPQLLPWGFCAESQKWGDVSFLPWSYNLEKVRAMVLNWGQFWPPQDIRQYLETSFTVITRGCCWLRASRSQGCCSILCYSPFTELTGQQCWGWETLGWGKKQWKKKVEKGPPLPRTLALSDVQILKEKAKIQSSRFQYQEWGSEWAWPRLLSCIAAFQGIP